MASPGARLEMASVTGYLTVGLILTLGAYGAFLLACRTREQGVVVATVSPLTRYLRALAVAAKAALEEMARLARAFDRAGRSVGLFQVNCTPLRVAALLAAPCANCDLPPSAHTVEPEFGWVCPIDAAARTDDERFTYTHPSEVT